MHFLCLHGMGTNAQVFENNFGLAPPPVFPITLPLLFSCPFFAAGVLLC